MKVALQLILLLLVTRTQSGEPSPAKVNHFRLFGKEIRITDEGQKPASTGASNSFSTEHHFGAHDRVRYTQADIDRLNFRYNPHKPKTESELSAMPVVQRARHSEPFAQRMVLVQQRGDYKHPRRWRPTDETNIAFIDRVSRRQKELRENRRSRFYQYQRQVTGSGEAGPIMKSRTNRLRASCGLPPNLISPSLATYYERNERAKLAGDQPMVFKDHKGHIRADKKGRTGNEYLLDIRAKQKRTRQTDTKQ